MSTKKIKSRVVAFLDTMVYAHYKPIDALDWCDLLHADEVLVVCPRITIRELDEIKDTHRNSKIRDRVRRVLKQIREWAANPQVPIRKGVWFAYTPTLVRVDYEALGLNPEWGDDQLLASVLAYQRENADASLVLVTQDTGPALKAASFDLPTVELPDEYRTPPELDDIERENQELRRKVQKMEAAQPALYLGILIENGETREHAKVSLQAPLPYPREAMAAELEKLKKRVPRLGANPGGPFGSVIVAAGPSAEEYARYNNERETYLREYEAFFQASWDHKNSRRRTIRTRLALVNDGGMPADDIDVRMRFPDGLTVTGKDDLPSAPEPPTEPRPPRSAHDMLIESMGRSFMPTFHSDLFDRISGVASERENVSDLRIEHGNSVSVSVHVRRVKHADHVELHPMYIIPDSYEVARSFHIDYQIRAANLPEPKTGRLHIEIETATSQDPGGGSVDIQARA